MTPVLCLMVALWDEELVGTGHVKTDDGASGLKWRQLTDSEISKLAAKL